MAQTEARGWASGRLRLVGVAIMLLAGASRASADAITTADRIYDREFSLWFGTLSVVGVPAFSQDFLELSDRVTDDLSAAISGDPLADARVKNALSPGGPWSIPGLTGMEWVLQPLDNFPAQQNLINAYSATALALYGPGALTLTVPVTTGREYPLGSFDTVEVAPVEVGDTDSPVLFGLDGQSVTITNKFVAQAHYVELNATWTPSPTSPVPEPASLALMTSGLVALAVRRYRRRR